MGRLACGGEGVPRRTAGSAEQWYWSYLVHPPRQAAIAVPEESKVSRSAAWRRLGASWGAHRASKDRGVPK